MEKAILKQNSLAVIDMIFHCITKDASRIPHRRELRTIYFAPKNLITEKIWSARGEGLYPSFVRDYNKYFTHLLISHNVQN